MNLKIISFSPKCEKWQFKLISVSFQQNSWIRRDRHLMLLLVGFYRVLIGGDGECDKEQETKWHSVLCFIQHIETNMKNTIVYKYTDVMENRVRFRCERHFVVFDEQSPQIVDTLKYTIAQWCASVCLHNSRDTFGATHTTTVACTATRKKRIILHMTNSKWWCRWGQRDYCDNDISTTKSDI